MTHKMTINSCEITCFVYYCIMTCSVLLYYMEYSVMFYSTPLIVVTNDAPASEVRRYNDCSRFG